MLREKLKYSKWVSPRHYRIAVARRLIRGGNDFFELARFYTETVEAPGNNFPFFVSSRDTTISRVLFGGSDFDLDVMNDAIRALVSVTGAHPLRQRHLIDVGANIGTTSVYAAKLYEADRVTAIEPSRVNAKLARCNATLNDVADRITVHQCAATNVAGGAELSLSTTHLGDHRVVATGAERVGQVQPEPAVVSVRAITLDDLDIDPASVGLIWIDTQGHEGHVLDGAHQLLRAGPPLVLEYAPDMLQRAKGLDLLEDVLAEHYTRFADAEESFRPRPIADLQNLRSTYQGRAREHFRGEGFTDLIVWRSSDDLATR
jgi:FkbM family methyltransferase